MKSPEDKLPLPMTKMNYKQLQKLYNMAMLDWADDEVRIENLARPILGDWVDGDDMGVPTPVDIVEKLIALIPEAKRKAR